jgi:hypothetical protein
LPISQLPINISSLANGYYVLSIISNQRRSQVAFLVARR